MNEKLKMSGSGGEGRWEGTGRNRDRANYNQDMLCLLGVLVTCRNPYGVGRGTDGQTDKDRMTERGGKGDMWSVIPVLRGRDRRITRVCWLSV